MLLLLSARDAVVCLCWVLFLGISTAAFGQTNYFAANGTEYAIIDSTSGDQVFPDLALNPTGGFVVWEDNATPSGSLGVNMRRLDGTLSGTLSVMAVNAPQDVGDQKNPRVALLPSGGAVVVWQGGQQGQQHIYARFLTPANTWVTTNDVLISSAVVTNVFYVTNTTTTITLIPHSHPPSYTTNTTTTIVTNVVPSTGFGSFQVNPAVAVLSNGNVVVVWASFDEVSSSSLLDVYGQILSPGGNKLGGEFLINQFISYNQRTPAVAALANGGFVVTWVSEQERTVVNLSGIDNLNGSSPSTIGSPSVDVYARLYDNGGVARPGGEFLVNTDLYPCANPSVAAVSDGSFTVAWGERDLITMSNSWDVYTRSFSGTNGGIAVRVNSHVSGSQYAPRISSIGADYLVTWTSLGQDGSREGVFGQLVHEGGLLVGGEFRVNTTTVGQQMQPAVASDGVSQFLVVWTSYTAGPSSFDLFAQRYVNAGAILQPITALYVYAPFTVVSNIYQPQLQASWPILLGISVSNYEVYVDGNASPMALTTNNSWTMTAANGLTTNRTHSFTVDYVMADGRRSPMSPSASGTTWSGLNYYGIPYEWMAAYFGGYLNGTYHTNYWPSVNAPLVPGGPTLCQVFLSGGNPLDSSTWLKITLTPTSNGMSLSWNTQPGFNYQVQVTTNFTSWSNLGSPWFAPGTIISIPVGTGSAGYYRVMLVR